MEQRHHRTPTVDSPGLAVPVSGVVELYPSAGILTAWFAAAPAAAAAQLPLPDDISADEPLYGSGAGIAQWAGARLPLGRALALISGARAHCVLPVPGDSGGLPPEATRARAAGQAMVVHRDDSSAVALSPLTLPGGDRIWHAEAIAHPGTAPPSLSDARRTVMSALDEAVTLAEAAVLPMRSDVALQARLTRLRDPHLPPGYDPRAAELAVRSATLLEIVTTVQSQVVPATGQQAHAALSALEPLGKAGRHALAAALSAPGTH